MEGWGHSEKLACWVQEGWGMAWSRPSETAREQEDKVCWTPTFGTFRRWP